MEFYVKNAGQHSEQDRIFKSCQDLYIHRKRSMKKPPNPDMMLRAMSKLCTHLELKPNIRSKIKSKIHSYIFDLKIQHNKETKMAPIFHPSELIGLIKTLWLDNNSINIRLKLARKQAALQAMFCLLTGRRWTDVTRIKWETKKVIVNRNGHFVKFLIPVSKSNKKGNRNETITLKANNKNIELCPITMLDKFHYWVGQPTNGFVFQCLAPKRQWILDPIDDNWSTYRCKGHWHNEQKQACLGQTSSTQSFGYIHRWAKSKRWKILPTKHTFRRTCLIIVKQLGISRKQINEGFGWVPHSDMIRHYTAEQDSITDNHPAIAIANQFERASAFDCLKNIEFHKP